MVICLWVTSNHYAVLYIVADMLWAYFMLEVLRYFLSHCFVEYLCMFVVAGTISVFVNDQHPVRRYTDIAYQEKLRIALNKMQTTMDGKVLDLQIENSKQKAVLQKRTNVVKRERSKSDLGQYTKPERCVASLCGHSI